MNEDIALALDMIKSGISVRTAVAKSVPKGASLEAWRDRVRRAMRRKGMETRTPRPNRAAAVARAVDMVYAGWSVLAACKEVAPKFGYRNPNSLRAPVAAELERRRTGD